MTLTQGGADFRAKVFNNKGNLIEQPLDTLPGFQPCQVV